MAFDLLQDENFNGSLYRLYEEGIAIGTIRVDNFSTYKLPVSNTTAFLWNFYIEEKSRNKGYGYKCLINLLSILKEKGFLAVGLRVVKNNYNALHLYKKVGFVVVENCATTYVMEIKL